MYTLTHIAADIESVHTMHGEFQILFLIDKLGPRLIAKLVLTTTNHHHHHHHHHHHNHHHHKLGPLCAGHSNESVLLQLE
jgi:hypothetical protein